MAPIPFPVSTFPGYRSQESNGRLINAFAEPIGEGTKDAAPPSKRVRVPGMTEFATSSQTGFRGMAVLAAGAGEEPIYVAFSGQLYKCLTTGGTLVLHAALAGTKPVYFARNNASTPDKVVVTENGAFVIVDPNTITDYSAIDADLPAGPTAVCSIDGYFVFTFVDGRIFASDLNSTAVNALSLGTAEVSPDQPMRPIPYSGRLLIFGAQTLEIWIDVGAQPFPFQRTVTVPFGLLGKDAVAGWEDGWGAGLLWVANDHTVRRLDGYTPVRVSPPDLERLIHRDTNKARMLANVHVVDGHPMWTVNGEEFTWSYDLNTGKWHERASYLTTRWRGLQTVNCFNPTKTAFPTETGGRWIVGDRNSGNIYEIDPTNHMEAADPLPLRIESGPVLQFPERVRVARADFHVEVGVGIATGEDPIQTDPTALISWSDDGGLNWSVPIFRKLGRQATYKNVSVTRVGMSTRLGRRWRIDISDPVYVALFGGEQSVELRKG